MKLNYSIPMDVNFWIESKIQNWKISPQKLAGAIHELSNHFTKFEGRTTPWVEISTGAAYFTYFFPLNLVRAQSLEKEASRWNFFAGLSDVIDFGAGLGSASLALHLAGHDFQYYFIEQSEVPKAWADESPLAFYKKVNWIDAKRARPSTKTLGVFSYSLIEQKEPPEWMYDCEALFIIEPSTQSAGRNLLNLRKTLIEKGYSIWAPCLHEKECPLLLHSKTDWCHHRLGFSAPSWFEEIERHLSMKNKTLTYSYLLARKTPRPSKIDLQKAARVTGDPLREKGKTRQMICRSTEREFLAVLEREKIDFDLDRGELIVIPDEAQPKSNELRLKRQPEVIS